jgi:hypothetical protein
LLQSVLLHQKPQHCQGRGLGQLVVLLLVAFNQEREQIRQFGLIGGPGILALFEFIESLNIALVLLIGADDAGRKPDQQCGFPSSFAVGGVCQDVPDGVGCGALRSGDRERLRPMVWLKMRSCSPIAENPASRGAGWR